MDYLFGDSTPSSLKQNFLEFLRDALDFSVFVVKADARIQEIKLQIATLRQNAQAEIEHLNTFVSAVQQAIEHAPKGTDDSPTSRCASQLVTSTGDALKNTLDAIAEKLAADVGEAEAKEQAERRACSAALETLLVPHDPPSASVVRKLELDASGNYSGNLVGEIQGLAWTLELGTAGIWSTAIRVGRLAPELEIKAPRLSGWITKQVKVEGQKVDRHVVSKFVDDHGTALLELREEPGTMAGFDIEVSSETGQVKASRVGAKDDGTRGPFEVSEDDASSLRTLAEKLRSTAAELKRSRLVSASVEGEDFEMQMTLIPFVERLVSLMAPIVHEIAARSLTHTELVLRRMLTDDCREEIFVTKASLREKYEPLSGVQRALFAPLGLETARMSRRPSDVPTADPPPVRSELAPSRPPPRLPPPVPPAARALTLEASGMNETLVATLKKIAGLTKDGSVDAAYLEYEALFTSAAFASAPPDDQRQVLRRMVLAKPPASSDAVIRAHRAAVLCLKGLIEKLDDPIDYETLGVTHLTLEDREAARQVFAAALARERVRNPGSELFGNLTRRIAAT